MGQEAVIARQIPMPPGQPMQEEAQGQTRPGEKPRIESQGCTKVQAPDPDERAPGQSCRALPGAVVVVAMINLVIEILSRREFAVREFVDSIGRSGSIERYGSIQAGVFVSRCRRIGLISCLKNRRSPKDQGAGSGSS